MCRTLLSLLVVVVCAVMALSVSGCEEPELPFDVWVESAAGDQKTDLYLSAIDEWNEVGNRCLGEPLITYMGLIDDDGFQVEDTADSRSVIYTEPFGGQAYQATESIRLTGPDGKLQDISGFSSFAGDSVIFWKTAPDYEEMKVTALHELGHFVGILEHLPDTGEDEGLPVMVAGVDPKRRSQRLTEADIRAFCKYWPCRPDCL